MIEVIISIITTQILIGYIINRSNKEKTELIREITRSIKANNINEYVETDPQDDELIVEDSDDEFQDVRDVDEEVLLKYLNREYEDKQN